MSFCFISAHHQLKAGAQFSANFHSTVQKTGMKPPEKSIPKLSPPALSLNSQARIPVLQQLAFTQLFSVTSAPKKPTMLTSACSLRNTVKITSKSQQSCWAQRAHMRSSSGNGWEIRMSLSHVKILEVISQTTTHLGKNSSQYSRSSGSINIASLESSTALSQPASKPSSKP